jgi:hypothetical protein
MARHPPPVEDHRILCGGVEGVVLVDVVDDADVVLVLFPATSSAAATAATMMTKMMVLQQHSHDDRARADGMMISLLANEAKISQKIEQLFVVSYQLPSNETQFSPLRVCLLPDH